VASFFTGNPDNTISGTTPLNDGVWHHVVATRVLGGDKNLYVDGQLENTGTTNIFALTANPIIDIGGNSLDNRYFTGSLNELSIPLRPVRRRCWLPHRPTTGERLRRFLYSRSDRAVRRHPGRGSRGCRRCRPGNRPCCPASRSRTPSRCRCRGCTA